jgi:hypothetical protein
MTKYRNTALIAAAVATGAGCAHVEAPTGGPDDRDPPELVAVTPDTLQRVPGLQGPVVFEFDERLSERNIDDRIAWVSPRTSGVRVERRGAQLRVGLRGGWEPGRVYHVTVLPGIQDLFGNRRTEPITTVFSTGPEIPDSRLVATVTDRLTGRVVVGARVEAITPDSLVYALPTDSAGIADFRRIPLGEYRVRAYNDANRNRELDDFEPRDVGTTTVAGPDSVGLALAIVMPDTTPPQLATIRVSRENLEIRFDDHLDPAQALTPGQVQIIGPDGTHVPVAQLGVGSLPPVDTVAVTVEDAAPAAPRLPSQTLVVRPAVALLPDTEYHVRVQQIRNVVGLAGDVEGAVRTPELPAAPEPEPRPAPSSDAPPPAVQQGRSLARAPGIGAGR